MPAADRSYVDELLRYSHEAALCVPVSESADIQCVACAHRCRISPGGQGRCQVRMHHGGVLRVPWGYVSSVACDPVEKKPFHHFLPGIEVLSFGMLGCNFRCPFCQNWSISQVLKDSEALVHPRPLTAAELVRLGEQRGTRAVAATYNEPLITAEWAGEIFRLARRVGMKTCMVSNGFASVECLDYLEPVLDAMNVDLKCFSEAGYRQLGGRLQPVLDTIESLWRRGKWVEVVTLVVPGFNDSDEELQGIAEFVAGVSVDIPWHVSAYHRDYRVQSGPLQTPPERLAAALRCGRKAGLRYVYTGNVALEGMGEDTHCPGCGRVLIERSGFTIRRCLLGADGCCPGCGERIPGIWN